ncbi:hypothetical protein H4696_003447 [Amycolatopsis lexingtonensis]|uniref:Uncharacterized protein n=1 Tax=Amycolatopsis lexingtonensis TaxID=218822 RepID=A0ABR9HZI1_9PSEU|nr:DUF2247 family protein [Amycolatopsis lexingtonensis]MBE1496347.1 hypothetical protein [Amycolatopsis lexingtonensis]
MAKFKIPGNFVIDRVDLTAGEVAYGRRRGWLDDSAVAQIYEHKMRLGRALSGVEEKWALALSGDVASGGLPDLPLGDSGCDRELRAVWIYLSLAWIYQSNLTEDALLNVIEELYSDFEYPEEMEGFVKYMPPPVGGVGGIVGMIERLEAFLRYAEDLYRKR